MVREPFAQVTLGAAGARREFVKSPCRPLAQCLVEHRVRHPSGRARRSCVPRSLSILPTKSFNFASSTSFMKIPPCGNSPECGPAGSTIGTHRNVAGKAMLRRSRNGRRERGHFNSRLKDVEVFPLTLLSCARVHFDRFGPRCAFDRCGPWPASLGPTSRSTASAGPFAGARERGGEGVCALAGRLQSGRGRPGGRGIASAPGGAAAAGFVDGQIRQGASLVPTSETASKRRRRRQGAPVRPTFAAGRKRTHPSRRLARCPYEVAPRGAAPRRWRGHDPWHRRDRTVYGATDGPETRRARE